MTAIRTCSYRDCFHNDNLKNTCLHEKITVGTTGLCETMIYCDDYVCSECERFDICTKEKKALYQKENNA